MPNTIVSYSHTEPNISSQNNAINQDVQGLAILLLPSFVLLAVMLYKKYRQYRFKRTVEYLEKLWLINYYPPRNIK